MAIRARLTPPREIQQQWNYHSVNSASLSASMLFGGDRRMEAESFLSDGFATRLRITSKPDGWSTLGQLSHVFQPNRLKGTLVSREYGVPFLAATQIFDIRPRVRKWLAIDQIADAAQLFVEPSTILMTRSGTVGRATLALDGLKGKIISDDLLRVLPSEASNHGWLYAYLRAPRIVKLMQAAHYGHVIKHLEVSHLNEVPVITVSNEIKQTFGERAKTIFEYRNRAEVLTAEAETILSTAFTLPDNNENSTAYSEVSSSELFSGRRRFEGAYYAAPVRLLLETLRERCKRIDSLGDIVERVWWMTRFSRNFGDGGVPYMSADELFAISQVSEKLIYTDPIPNHRDFFVQQGWILMACSGQTYGLNGSVTLATAHEENFFFSHDLIRIAPNTDAVRSGYLFAYLGHPELGQVLVKRAAYGSSIPHIDPTDVESVPVARLSSEVEGRIADLAEEAARLRAVASSIEREIAMSADDIIAEFIQ